MWPGDRHLQLCDPSESGVSVCRSPSHETVLGQNYASPHISRPLELSYYFVRRFHDFCHAPEVWLPTRYICEFPNSVKVTF